MNLFIFLEDYDRRQKRPKKKKKIQPIIWQRLYERSYDKLFSNISFDLLSTSAAKQNRTAKGREEYNLAIKYKTC